MIRRVVVLLVLLLAVSLNAQPGFAATIVHLQSAAVTGGVSATSLPLAFPSPNTAGSFIVAAVSFDSSSGTTWSCSDSQGNTYAIALLRNDTRHSQALGICYAAAVKGGANTVTVTYGGLSHPWRALAIHEYSGVAATAVLDQVAGATGKSTAPNSSAVVPTQAGELIFGVVDVNDGSNPTITAGAGFTVRQGVPDVTTEDRVLPTATSIAATFGLSSSQDFNAIVATFKASSDVTPPSVPSGLVTNTVSMSQIKFSWTASTDNVGVTGYKVYRNGVQIATVAATSYTDTNLTPGSSYSYTVAAYDAVNNTSAQSAVLNASTLADTTAPTISILSPLNNATVAGTITVTTNVSDDVAVGGVTFRVDGVPLGPEDTTAPFSITLDTATLGAGTHVFTAIARDTSNNTTTSAAVTVVVYIDRTAPSAPFNLQAQNITSTAATLSWTPATDDVGVAGYLVFRNGTQIGTTTSTTYVDSGLTTSTIYIYAVFAYDSSNNMSAQSAPLTVTTASGPYIPAYPLKVDPTKRYLIDQNNVPFLMFGDSPQPLFTFVSETDVENYFITRQAQGFNTVWVNLVCNQYTHCDNSGRTYDGVPPFTTAGNLATPNEVYFSRMDRMLALAAKYHFLVVLDPIETGGWLQILINNGVTKDRAYGQYLGNRYKNVDNIIWMSGNDFADWTNTTADAAARAVALGILDVDQRHVHTLELGPDASSSTYDSTWAPIITVDAAYTYYATYDEVLKEYNRVNHMPVFMVEANYEGEQNCTCFDFGSPSTLRRQEYWAMLSGSTGQLYGTIYTDQLPLGWQSNLNTPGAIQFSYLNQLFGPRRWFDLVPDTSHTVVTAGYGTYISTSPFGSNNYVTAGATADGALVMAYVPQNQAITVDLRKLSGQVAAQWFDPANGTFRPIAGSPFANTGPRQFAHPGPNSDGDVDWVLVLEATPAPVAASGPPTQASAVSPSGTIAQTTPIFSWSADGSATYYEVAVSDGSSTSPLVAWYTPAQAGCSLGGVCAVLAPKPLPAGLVSWAVITWNAFGYGPWSATKTVVVDLVDAAGTSATLVAPSGPVVTRAPAYVWSAVSAATWYQLSITDALSVTREFWYTPADACAATTCTVMPDVVLPVGAAQWKLRVWRNAGAGPWTNAVAFTTITPSPGMATPVSPVSAVTTRTPSFTWTAVSGTAYYLLRLVDRDGVTFDRWYLPGSVGCPSGAGTCTASPGISLNAGAAAWAILTWNGSSYGPWSPTGDFLVEIPDPAAPIPVAVAPTGTVAAANVVFQWTAVAGARTYRLSIRNNGGSPAYWWFTPAAAGCVATQQCSGVTDAALINGTAEWQVQVWTVNGYGPWSPAIALTVNVPKPTTPALIAPSGAIGTTSPVFQWNNSTNAALYYVAAYDITGLRVGKWLTPSQAGCAGGGICSLNAGVTFASGAGQWQAIAWNQTGYSLWSSMMAFVVP